METLKQRIQTCESIRRLSLTVEDLRFNKTDQINTVLQSSLRKQIFFNYGYDTLASIEDSYFLGLFETHLSTRGSLTTLVNSSLELQDHPVDKIIERQYQMAIENIKIYCETKCYELKLALLGNYFLLPVGSANHVQNLLKCIERLFTDTYANTIHTFQVTAKIRLSEQHIQKAISSPEVVVTTRFSNHTTQILETFYEQNDRPKISDKSKLAKATGLSIEQIETWFNNKRSRAQKGDTGLCEKQVREFMLETEIDWVEQLKLVEKDSLTSEDTRCIDNVDHVIEIPPSPESPGSIEVDNQSTSSSETRYTSKLISRSKFTKNARKMASPYATSRPRKGKSTGLRSVRITPSTVENSPENGRAGPANLTGLIKATLTASPSSSANITSSPTNLKVRVSFNKSTARARAQPYSCIPPKRLRKTKSPSTNSNHANNASVPAIHIANDSCGQIYTKGFLQNMTPSTDSESYFTESLDKAFDRNNKLLPIMDPDRESNLAFLAEQYYNGLSGEQSALETALILSPVSISGDQQQCFQNVHQTIGRFDAQETEVYDDNVNYQLSNDETDLNLQSLSSSFLPSNCFQAYNQFTCEGASNFSRVSIEGFDDESSSTQSKSTQSESDYPLDEAFLFDSNIQESVWRFSEPYFVDTVLANNGEFSSFIPHEGFLASGCMATLNSDADFLTDETLNVVPQNNISVAESSPWVILTDDDQQQIM
ncbi:7368_t:CDS:1 [Paraglomus brasilianum]|uniref:7368_t:CDS:1 n=1 Tax=Paraglomus brasilianum TaxID=144538 RepID=A0A9N9CFM2_9GLOM|nr:7368_t:CDS:1 [Paraglomus brasilianum]